MPAPAVETASNLTSLSSRAASAPDSRVRVGAPPPNINALAIAVPPLRDNPLGQVQCCMAIVALGRSTRAAHRLKHAGGQAVGFPCVLMLFPGGAHEAEREARPGKVEGAFAPRLNVDRR